MNAKEYVAYLHTLPCIATLLIEGKIVPAEEVHHIESIRDGLSDFAAIPLCTAYHRGANGVHQLSRRGFERRYKLSEIDLLAATIKEVVKRR
jgi:hypothetical protein